MMKPMIEITALLDTVHGGNGAQAQAQTQTPLSGALVFPEGTKEARPMACMQLPSGNGGSSYPSGSWLCRETAEILKEAK